MAPWSRLTADEMQLLETTFWSAGGSRHGMAEQLGFSKSKANSLIAGLVEQGLLAEAGLQRSSGGRRPENLQLHGGLGVLVGVDIGATSLEVAVLAPDLAVLAHHAEPADVREGPGVVLARVRALMRELLARAGFDAGQVIGIGIGVPGPVDFEIGQLVNPPLMPALGQLLDPRLPARRLRTRRCSSTTTSTSWRSASSGGCKRSLSNFLVIKVGTGIGCGIVCHGEVYRGAAGSAGDVGHICVDQEGPRCHCGNLGCVETMAAGPAITRMAVRGGAAGRERRAGRMPAHAGPHRRRVDVGQASRAGDAAANAIVQRAGILIGQMLASVVNFFNPSHVFIGGGVTRIGPLFLAAVRQSVYQRSLALSTRHLEIQYTPLGARPA